jgi:hypothetical protein
MHFYVSNEMIFDVPQSIDALLHELKVYEDIVNSSSDELSQEALNSMLSRIFESSLNVFGRIVNYFKSDMVKFITGKVRTDLKLYCDTNMATVRRIMNTQYTDIMSKRIHIPTGLQESYIKATDRINGSYEIINFINILKSTSVTFKSIFKSMSNNNSNNIEAIMKTQALNVTAHEKQIGVIHNGLVNSITLKRTHSGFEVRPFNQVYSSMTEFKQVKDKILMFSKLFNEIGKSTELTEECSSTVSGMVNLMQNDNTIRVSKAFITHMQAYMRYLAVLTEVYGILAQNAMMLEHNYVLTLKELAK